MSPARILIVKHGALGDLVLASGPMAAIRAYHAAADITILTTPPFADFLAASPYADAVWPDERPGLGRPGRIWRVAKRLRRGNFDRVYDLQTSDRSSAYFRLFGRRRPEWSGIARGCSHPDSNPRRTAVHTIERQREQLRLAGIESVPAPSLDWVPTGPPPVPLPARYGLLVPGGAAHRADKRWPTSRFAALAGALADRNIVPVVIGGSGERTLAREIRAVVPPAIDLCGCTDLFDLVNLARGAALAVGNDTGPMHIAAVAGCASMVLFGPASDPARTAPRGPRVSVLRAEALTELGVDRVRAACEDLLAADVA